METKPIGERSLTDKVDVIKEQVTEKAYDYLEKCKEVSSLVKEHGKGKVLAVLKRFYDRYDFRYSENGVEIKKEKANIETLARDIFTHFIPKKGAMLHLELNTATGKQLNLLLSGVLSKLDGDQAAKNIIINKTAKGIDLGSRLSALLVVCDEDCNLGLEENSGYRYNAKDVDKVYKAIINNDYSILHSCLETIVAQERMREVDKYWSQELSITGEKDRVKELKQHWLKKLEKYPQLNVVEGSTLLKEQAELRLQSFYTVARKNEAIEKLIRKEELSSQELLELWALVNVELKTQLFLDWQKQEEQRKTQSASKSVHNIFDAWQEIKAIKSANFDQAIKDLELEI